MEKHEVLVIPPVSDEVLHRIQNVDRRARVVDARGWFDVELRATRPQWTVDRMSPITNGVKLSCENLTRYLEGLPLENVIDWERGY